MKHFLFFFVAGAITLSACNSGSAENKDNKDSNANKDTVLSSAEMKKITEERNQVYDKAMVDGDSLNIVQHFSSDCVVLPPNGDQIVGKASIIPTVMAFSRMGIKKFTDETTRVLDGGDYIIEEGNYFLGGDNNSTLDKGKYLCVWKKEDGEWRVCSNMWNTSMPASATKKK
jgi:ketosteroid isomerase-like protein